MKNEYKKDYMYKDDFYIMKILIFKNNGKRVKKS